MARLPPMLEPLPGEPGTEAWKLNKLMGLPKDASSADRLAEVEHLVAFYRARKKQAKLTEHQALEIRRLYGQGRPVTQLQRDFKVSHSTIYDILRRRTWGGP